MHDNENEYSFCEVYSGNEIIDDAVENYRTQLHKISANDEGLYSRINFLNTEVLEFLCLLDMSKLFISITTSNSLFYRFSVSDIPCEFKLECFVEGNADDIDAALHVYIEGKKDNSYFGTISEMANIINATIQPYTINWYA